MADDISDLAEQAKNIAEATGRDEADVLADPLDDGKVNNSHQANQKDLVTQLKEAAELITTVQNIGKEVSENSVLNGGENKTEVKVETTLEGDLVDRAIDSVQRKADNIKKLVLTLAPIFLLITGGTMESIGWIDLFGDEESSEATCDMEWYLTDEMAFYNTDQSEIEVFFSLRDMNSCEDDTEELRVEFHIHNETTSIHDDYQEITVFDGESHGHKFHAYDIPDGDYELVLVLIDGDGEFVEDWRESNFRIEGGETTVYGCTDQAATNYDSTATDDDGSCTYGSGTDPSVEEYVECEEDSPLLCHDRLDYYSEIKNNTNLTIRYNPCGLGASGEWHMNYNYSMEEGYDYIEIKDIEGNTTRYDGEADGSWNFYAPAEAADIYINIYTDESTVSTINWLDGYCHNEE